MRALNDPPPLAERMEVDNMEKDKESDFERYRNKVLNWKKELSGFSLDDLTKQQIKELTSLLADMVSRFVLDTTVALVRREFDGAKR